MVRLIASFFSILLLLLLCVIGGRVGLFAYYGQDLPDYAYLKDYQPPILTRLYANDGRMMATLAAEKRIFVPIASIPKMVQDAFIAAEDSGFYNHGGVDYLGMARAVMANLYHLGQGRRPVGASTITQQVAKNMLLGNELSLKRKMREVILATRLDSTLSKNRILEIYLNEIFLGNHSYGIAAAALNYFNKSLDELTLAESAFLAALPKAPNNYQPTRNAPAALLRRNWVLTRMLENGFVSTQEASLAMLEPLQTRTRLAEETVAADYFSEEVRRTLITQFGEAMVLRGGLAVKTSLEPKLQTLGTKALRDGLIDFDRRVRGYRGAVAHLNSPQNWQENLRAIPKPAGGQDWPLAVVLALFKDRAVLGFANGEKGTIPLSEMRWARRELPNNQFGSAVRVPSDVVAMGDVILVEAVRRDAKGKAYPAHTYTLRQVPAVQGALVALDPHTGRVFAMVGGFSDRISQFNRANQALRQPGSAFKPFVYMAALESGLTPSSLILDAPVSYPQGPGLPQWQPENYSQTFLGPTTLRAGIEKSRNVMTVRLAHELGMEKIVAYAKKFGIVDDMPELLSFSLGAKETSLLRLTTAYGMIANGGKKIMPSLIDRVQDRDGRVLWRADNRACDDCQTPPWQDNFQPPMIADRSVQIVDPRVAYQMISMLEGVVARGTAASLAAMDLPLAGKTGTTNASKDAWFIGFTPNLVCGVYIGFDDPKTLGSHETGGSLAVPVFRDFMAGAMAGRDAGAYTIPSGLRMVRVDAGTGQLSPSGKDTIWEAFIPGSEPREGVPQKILGGEEMTVAAPTPPVNDDDEYVPPDRFLENPIEVVPAQEH